MKATTIYQARQQAAIEINVPRININAEQVREQLKPAKIYRQELKLYRRMAQVIDRHPFAVNAALWLAGIATMVHIFLYY